MARLASAHQYTVSLFKQALWVEKALQFHIIKNVCAPVLSIVLQARVMNTLCGHLMRLWNHSHVIVNHQETSM